MNMKRFLMILLSAVMILTAATVFASAAEPTFSVKPSGTVAPGETVTVELSLENAAGFVAATILVEWDPDVMSYENIALTENEGRFSVGGKIRDDAANFVVILSSAFEDAHLPLAELQMKIEDFSEVGYELSVSVQDADIDGVPEPERVTVNLSGDASSGTDSPTSLSGHIDALDDFYIGDADGNGKVTAGDARTILRHAARIEALAEEYAPLCDINRDGKIKSNDARIALRMAARVDTLFLYKDGYHEHQFRSETTKAPTCTEPGERTKTCTVCGYSVTETIPKTAHDFAPATLTEPKTCRVCGATEGKPLSEEIRISAKETSLTLKKGGCAFVEIDAEYPEGVDCRLTAESADDALMLMWASDSEGSDVDLLFISAAETTSGTDVTVYVDGMREIGITIRVRVESGNSANYTGSGVPDGVPDFGVFTGVAPEGFLRGTLDDGRDFAVYYYSVSAIDDAQGLLDTTLDRFADRLTSKGFSFSSYDDPYYTKKGVTVAFELVSNVTPGVDYLGVNLIW